MKQILDQASINRSLKRLTHEIIEHNEGVEQVVLVGIKTRGIYLAQRIAQFIKQLENKEIEVINLDIAPWRDDIQHDLERTQLPIDINGKQVVLVDDVLYSGRTIRAAMDAVIDSGRPASIQCAVLVDRVHRELPIRADYVGKNIPSSRRERIFVRLQEVDGVDEVLLDRIP